MNTNLNKCAEISRSSSLFRLVYSEIEEVGWERLVRLADDLSFVSFRIFDKKERVHILEILLDESYPNCAPSISADVPYMFDLEWSMNSRLKNVVQQFRQHVEKLQEFWSTLDDIDHSLWVSDATQSRRGTPYRKINIGDDCFVILCINVKEPRSLPECRFMGSDEKVNSLRNAWGRNCIKWMKDNLPSENLATVLEIQLPGPPFSERNDQQIECGICYAQYLPLDDELGTKSGSRTDYTCENSTCNKAFHTVCLGDWLCSITTTRQSFDVLFGNCPYCSEPVAVKISSIK